MPGNTPDPLALRVLWQGEDQPCRVQLALPDGSTHEGSLDVVALRATLAALEPVWRSGEPAAYGKALFNHLFSGALGYHYGAALGAAGERGVRLQLRLDDKAPLLHTIPWERLYHPHGADWVPLAAAPDVLFSRYLSAGSAWGLPLLPGPLRALIVVPSPYPPGHNLFVEANQERAAIEEVWRGFPGKITPEFLEGPVTLDAIAAKLDEGDGFDILHYTGHGLWKPDEQTAYLILEKPEAGGLAPQGVSAEEFADRLRRGRRLPRLIFLAACQSAQQSTTDAFLGVGPKLVEAGCPAVIAMQDRVQVDVARDFAEQFYAQLLGRGPGHGVVDLAVNRARNRLHERWDWQWAVPVLYMRLLNGVLFRPEQRFPPSERKPYKGLAPYTANDHDLFQGRTRETAEICASLDDHPLTVVYGKAGVGLTSLMEAGIRPLLEQRGVLVVRVSEYEDIASEFREHLESGGRPLRLAIPGDAALAQALLAVSAESFPRLVLVLDQFERAFDLPAGAQDRLFAALAEGMTAVGAYLRMVFVIHEERLPALSAHRDRLEGLMQSALDVSLLDREAAGQAIAEPLRVLNWPVTVVPETLVGDLVVPDLAELTDGADLVVPGNLQIVCDRLYRRAREPDGRRAITEELYLSEKGAEGIIAGYLRQKLETELAAERSRAERLLAAMASPGAGRWVSPATLSVNGESVQERVDVLAHLAGLGMLSSRQTNGQARYAFANHVVAQEARRLGGAELEQRYRAGDELERIWSAWLARDAPASREQLRYLAAAGAHLTPRAVQVLLLMRSAILAREPAGPWLAMFCAQEAGALIRQLELPAEPDLPGAKPAGRATLDKARRLLGLHDIELPTPAQDEQLAFGVVAWSAVSHPDAVTRQTAALALSALERHEALDRLEWALQHTPAPVRSRRAELRGALADADPKFVGLNAALSRLDRLAVWRWRVQRRFTRNRSHILTVTLGGAIGAGLGLGVLRGVLAPLTGDTPGLQFAMSVWWGIILGAALTFGMMLADVLLVGSSATGEEGPALWRLPVPPGALPALLAVSLGTLFFGSAHLLLAFATGLFLFVGKVWVVLSGFVAGLGLSLALSDRPWVAPQETAGRWLFRLGVVGALSALAQLLFFAVKSDLSMTVVKASSSYAFNMGRYNWAWWQSLMQQFPQWPQVFGLLDSVLVGWVLFAGTFAGVRRVADWLRRHPDYL